MVGAGRYSKNGAQSVIYLKTFQHRRANIFHYCGTDAYKKNTHHKTPDPTGLQSAQVPGADSLKGL